MKKTEEHKQEVEGLDGELDIDVEGLGLVTISDDDLELVDKKKEQAKKHAKKNARLHRTPEEKKRTKRKKIIISTVVGVVILILLFAIPFTRWPILNAAGLRSTIVVSVTEKRSKQPISGVLFKLDTGQFALSDDGGNVQFTNVKLGARSLFLQKSGYSEMTIPFTAGIGTTKLASPTLKAIGVKLDIDINDWLSQAPIAKARVSIGDIYADSDDTGRASLIVPPTNKNEVSLTVTAPGYVQKVVEVQLNVQTSQVSLVADQKNYFISNRDGKYDIFSSNIDGTNQQRIIAATGIENPDLLQFSIDRNNSQALLVATRESSSKNGRIIAGVYAVDLAKAGLKKIDEGSDVQLQGWASDTMIYTKTDPNLNYDDPALTKLMSYNVTTGKLTLLTQSNYMPVTLVANNKVFYMPADAYRTIDNAALTSIDVTNGAHKTYLESKQIAFATQPGNNTVELQATDGSNFQIQVSSGSVQPLSRAPAPSFLFSTNQDGSKIAWTGVTDGQGTLFIQDSSGKNQRTVVKSAGLTGPVRLISPDLAVVRVVTTVETADYVVSLSNGKMAKIENVSNIKAPKTDGL